MVAFLMTYYTSLVATSLYYFVVSILAMFGHDLPWTICRDELKVDGEMCVGTFKNMTEALLSGNGSKIISSSEEFYHNFLLNENGSGADSVQWNYLFLVYCLLFCFIAIFFLLNAGKFLTSREGKTGLYQKGRKIITLKSFSASDLRHMINRAQLAVW